LPELNLSFQGKMRIFEYLHLLLWAWQLPNIFSQDFSNDSSGNISGYDFSCNELCWSLEDLQKLLNNIFKWSYMMVQNCSIDPFKMQERAMDFVVMEYRILIGIIWFYIATDPHKYINCIFNLCNLT
jgi:hypothetical protein